MGLMPRRTEAADVQAATGQGAVEEAIGEVTTAGSVRPALVTRFGSKVDVRNRGAVRIRRLAGGQLGQPGIDGVSEGSVPIAPAVVRLWHADRCDELTISEARALAAQLIAAAALADGQNRG